jgi:hypothetical protein
MSDVPNYTHYLRLAFTGYWTDSCPSAEKFYVLGKALNVTLTDVYELESEVLGMMTEWYGDRITEVTYIGHINVRLSDTDVIDEGWYVFDPESIQPLPVG